MKDQEVYKDTAPPTKLAMVVIAEDRDEQTDAEKAQRIRTEGKFAFSVGVVGSDSPQIMTVKDVVNCVFGTLNEIHENHPEKITELLDAIEQAGDELRAAGAAMLSLVLQQDDTRKIVAKESLAAEVIQVTKYGPRPMGKTDVEESKIEKLVEQGANHATVRQGEFSVMMGHVVGREAQVLVACKNEHGMLDVTPLADVINLATKVMTDAHAQMQTAPQARETLSDSSVEVIQACTNYDQTARLLFAEGGTAAPEKTN